jgi:hypothetical protein
VRRICAFNAVQCDAIRHRETPPPGPLVQRAR